MQKIIYFLFSFIIFVSLTPISLLADNNTLIYSKDSLDITLKKSSMDADWLDPYYTMYKLTLTNKSDSEVKVQGDIYNRVSKEEIKRKIAQIRQQKSSRNRSAMAGGYALIGVVGVAAAGAMVAATNASENKLYSMVKNRLVDGRLVEVQLSAKGKEDIFFVVARKEEPEMIWKVDSDLVVKGLSYEVAKTVAAKTPEELINLSFSKGALNESSKMGAYFSVEGLDKASSFIPILRVKTTYVKWTDSLDKAYFTEEQASSSTEKDAPSTKTKTTSSWSLPGLASDNTFVKENFQIFVKQNIYREPESFSIALFKMHPSKKTEVRLPSGSSTPVIFKEIEDGVYEIKPVSKLSPGEYALRFKLSKDKDLFYDFTLTK